MPRKRAPVDLADVERALDAVGEDGAARRRGRSGMPSMRAKSLPRPPGRTPRTPSRPAQGVGDRADQPVAAERDGDLARRGRRARQRRGRGRGRVVCSMWKATPQLRQRRLARAGSAAAARPPPACGLTMSAARRPIARPARGRPGWARSARRRAGPGSAARTSAGVVLPVSTIAPSMPAAARGAEVGVHAVADDQRPAGTEPVQRGADELGVGLADVAARARRRGLDRGDDRARARPRAVGHRERRVAPGAHELGAAAATACTALAQLVVVAGRRARRRRRRRRGAGTPRLDDRAARPPGRGGASPPSRRRPPTARCGLGARRTGRSAARP